MDYVNGEVHWVLMVHNQKQHDDDEVQYLYYLELKVFVFLHMLDFVDMQANTKKDH